MKSMTWANWWLLREIKTRKTCSQFWQIQLYFNSEEKHLKI